MPNITRLMAIQSVQPEIRLPLAKLAEGLGIGALAALAVAAALSAAAGGLTSALMGGAAAIIGTWVGLGVLAISGPRTAFAWAGFVLAASGARMAAGLSVGVWMHMTAHPAVMPFWGTFLLVSFVVLGIEVKLISPILRGDGHEGGDPA